MKHPIDKFFRDRLKNQHFDFDYRDWEKASALIDQKDKRRKYFVFWFLLGLAGLCFLAWVYAYGTSTQKVSENTEGQPVAKAHRPLPNEVDPLTVGKVPDEDSSVSDENPNGQLADASLPNPTGTAGPVTKSSGGRQGIGDAVASFRSEVEPRSALGTLSATTIRSDGEGLESADRVEQLGQTSEAELPKQVASVSFLEPLQIVPFDVAIATGSVGLRVLDLSDDLRPVFTPIRNGLGLYSALSFYPYFEKNVKSYRGNALGLFLRQSLLGGLGLQMGLGMNYVNGTYGVSQSTEIITRDGGFSFEKKLISLKPHGVYYLQAPLNLEWFSARSVLSFGVSLNKILSVRATKIEDIFDASDLLGKTKEQITPRSTAFDNVWMNRTAFNSIFWQLQASYKHQITSHWNIGLGLQYGLNSITSEEGQGLLREVKPFMLQLTTEINLWR